MIEEVTNHIGVLKVRIIIPEAQSLKNKRSVLKRIKDKTRNTFNVSVAELDGEDKWQVATLGFCMIGRDNRYIDSILQNILYFLDGNHSIEICEHEIEFC